MNAAAKIQALEARAAEHRLRMSDVLREAGIDRSMWTRWKNGTTVPRLDNWLDVEQALDRLVEKAAA